MKHILDYIKEGLSEENIKRIEQFISDEDIDKKLEWLAKYSEPLTDEAEKLYNDFFKKHGIADLNWGRKGSALKSFMQLFSEEQHLSILDAIIRNNGSTSIDKLASGKESTSGNIFDFCKISVNGELQDFSDEAKVIATWINSKSAAAGPCEMLLKFILNEGTSFAVGDVGIIPDKEMEVKAATVGKNASGGHAAGQTKDGESIRGAWAIYYWLNEHLFNIDNSNHFADKCAYFQNNEGIADFQKKVVDSQKTKKEIVKEIVDACRFQYDFIKNDGTEKQLNNLNNLYKSAEEFLDFDGKQFSRQNLLNLVGCIQLYLYSQFDGFDYFFCIKIDKGNTDSEATDNGNYVVFKNCKSGSLLNFNEITKYIKFGTLDSSTSNQGRTGKMYFK